MASRKYIERLAMVIWQLHKCDCKHVEPVPVREVFRGQTAWEGDVEVFDLVGHPKAKRCYGWSHREGPNDSGERFVTVLQIPPVTSPETAVKIAILNEARTKK